MNVTRIRLGGGTEEKDVEGPASMQRSAEHEIIITGNGEKNGADNNNGLQFISLIMCIKWDTRENAEARVRIGSVRLVPHARRASMRELRFRTARLCRK